MTKALAVAAAYLLLVMPALSAEGPPPAGANAALRYWMAFALMENPPAGGDVAKRLVAVAEGEADWDPSLAPILDRNDEALSTMRRGSRLPLCDWGYEYDQLADAPVAHLPRARAIGRLNVLAGRRLAGTGRSPDAVDVWLAGMRFSRDIAADGPWLAALIAASGLKAHLAALTSLVRDGKVDAAGRAHIERELGALAEAGFDWSVAARLESEGTSALLASMEKDRDPVARLEKYFPPDSQDMTGRRAETAKRLGLELARLDDRESVRAAVRRARVLNDELRTELVAAFAMRSDDAAAVLGRLDRRAAEDPLLSSAWSATARHNEVRGEVATARAGLLALVRSR